MVSCVGSELPEIAAGQLRQDAQGFVNLLEIGQKHSRHIKQDYLFPRQTAEEFSLLFIIKTGWTGNLIQFFSSSELPPVIHLFRISLTSSSLMLYNEKGESVRFGLQPGTATWRQLAVRVVKDSIALYSTCEDAPMISFPRNLTLWREGGVVVGDEDHESEDHLEGICQLLFSTKKSAAKEFCSHVFPKCLDVGHFPNG
ncbi:Hypothetical predicted protein, partial [Paramuricea clavata]